MKKLAIMVATSTILAMSSSHAAFTASGNTGTTKLTVTEQCQVMVTGSTSTKTRGELIDGARVGALSLNARGCNTEHAALRAQADNYHNGKIVLLREDQQARINVRLVASDGGQWTNDGATTYRDAAGDWGGSLYVVVDRDNTSNQAGSYTLNMDGGYWVS